MARTFSKTLMITRATYKTVEVVDGEPHFVDHPDAIFGGLLEQDKVERLLKAQLGKDAMIVVTKVDAGQHRYEMDLETFVLNARIADDEPEEVPDADPDPDPDASPNGEPDSASGGSASVSEPAPVEQTAPAPDIAPTQQGETAAENGSSGPAPDVREADEDDGIEI